MHDEVLGIVVHDDLPPPSPELEEEFERQIAAKPRGLWKPKRVEVDEFFDGLVDLYKRTQGHDGAPQ